VRWEMCIKLYYVIVRGNHQEDLDVDGSIFLKLILEKLDGGVWTGFICLG
jgi:hypothetical protein